MTKIKIVISNNVYTKKGIKKYSVFVNIVNTFLLNIGHQITTNWNAVLDVEKDL